MWTRTSASGRRFRQTANPQSPARLNKDTPRNPHIFVRFLSELSPSRQVNSKISGRPSSRCLEWYEKLLEGYSIPEPLMMTLRQS